MRVDVTVRVRRFQPLRLRVGWMIICWAGATVIDVAFASAAGTTNTIVPNINDKTINFLIIPPLFDSRPI